MVLQQQHNTLTWQRTISADRDYDVGTVLVFGGEQELTTTKYKGDRKVAGVVMNPAHLMNSDLQGDPTVALQGRTPCKVIGKVEKGDIIVTSAVEGYGMVDNNPNRNCDR